MQFFVYKSNRILVKQKSFIMDLNNDAMRFFRQQESDEADYIPSNGGGGGEDFFPRAKNGAPPFASSDPSFLFFENAQDNGRFPGVGSGGGGGGSKRSSSAAALIQRGDYISFEDICALNFRQQRKREIEKRRKIEVARRNYAEIGDARVALDETEAELELAEAATNTLYYSSCSDDEFVLEATLNQMQSTGIAAPPPRFEEDSVAAAAVSAAAAAAAAAAPESAAPVASLVVEQEKLRHCERVAQLRASIATERQRLGETAPVCFKCSFGSSKHDSVRAADVRELFALMEREVGRRDFRAIAKSVHRFFKYKIYIPAIRRGRQLSMWRTRDIFMHLQKHENEPRVMICRNISMLNDLAEVLRDKTHVRDPENPEKTIVNVNNIRELRETLKLAHAFACSEPKRMIFYDDSAAINVGAAASNRTTGAFSTHTTPSTMILKRDFSGAGKTT